MSENEIVKKPRKPPKTKATGRKTHVAAPGKTLGRPIKFTPEVQDQIESDLLLGLTLEKACIRAMVHPTILISWQTKAANGDEDAAEIFARFDAARMNCEVKALAALWQQGLGDPKNGVRGSWQCICWILERTRSEYALVNKLGGKIDVENVSMRDISPEAAQMAKQIIMEQVAKQGSNIK